MFMPTALSPESLLAELPTFFSAVDALLSDIGVDAGNLPADHLAIRVNSLETAQTLYPQWQAKGRRISDAIINGRPIWIVKLTQPLTVARWTIPCIELPFPTQKRYPNEGWEHVEFVIPGGALTLDELERQLALNQPAICLEERQLAAKGISLKRSSPKAESEQLPNPTLAFKRDNICVKFHSFDIEAVIASEQSR
uniref:VOC family protein n=1 Tax=Thaumasiovibrio occultus TaxID=1891184 RepID=UPI000B35E326|nr:VOC family protein [Thaumasiovibrio occultus]